ncbi:MAG: protease modulator HflC [Alphaproteobacteria bacterium]|jgi:modulator of FtsH protease HflC|nr:protease modulator HflC [Alphaproteobacteria bacterium]MBT5390353.1 protease modulator HflC [Alphaproteobacteria bacterium]MBT5540958.1 protease modulator HflC [Alphaproteobacteria bacterium]
MKQSTVIIALISIGVLFVLGTSTFFTVHQTEQALVLQFGDPIRTIDEPGLKMKIPFVQNVVYYDKRLLALDVPSEEVIALDQKRLVADMFLRYHIVKPLRFFQSVGTEEMAKTRLAALMVGSLRRILGQVPLGTMLSKKREDIMDQIQQEVNTAAQQFGLSVTDVRIKRADLPKANSEAIYARMNSEREREAKEFRAQGMEISEVIKARAEREQTVILAEAERDAQILRGEGDKKSVEVYGKSFGKDPDFFEFYRSMEANKAALGNDKTTFVLSPQSDFFKYFGTSKKGNRR